MFLILLLYMILASTFTLAKAALEFAQPIFFIGVRMTIAGSLLLLYIYFFKREWLKYDKKDVWLFIQIALFHIYIAYVLEFIALEDITSAKACLLYSLSPFITALFSYLFFAERLSAKKWCGLLIGVMGFLPTLMASAPAEGQAFFFISLPELLLLGSVVSSVQGWTIMKQLVKYREYSPVMVNAVGMIVGGLFALVTALIVEKSPYIVNEPGALGMTMLYMGLLILVANVIFYNLYGFLLHRYSATFLSFAGFTCPLFAAIYGRIFLGETISANFFLSVAIIVVGLTIFYQEELKIV